jgi:hypothetical protein
MAAVYDAGVMALRDAVPDSLPGFEIALAGGSGSPRDSTGECVVLLSE